MNDLTDQQLLRNYAERQSETAFAELVRRHVDLVYSAGLRMVRDSHLAEDVTQAVFVALAQNARQLGDRPVLSGWLHRTAQNLASKSVRSEVRRRAREQEAAAMNELFSAESDISWEHIAPHLDAALGELTEPDRDALFLRYFERKSAREIAAALGISDETAQKRVSRAVERLRELFAKRGVTTGASGLVILISANAVQAAPIGLAVTIAAAATLAGTTIATTATAPATKAIAMTTLQKTIVTAALAVAVGAGIYEAKQSAVARAQVRMLRQQQAPLADQIQQLQREKDEAANRLTTLAEEMQRLKGNSSELLKLRGEVGRLRAESQRFSSLKPANASEPADAGANLQPNPSADEASFKLESVVRQTQSRQGALACIRFAQDHQGQLPGDLEQLKTYLPNGGFAATNWEIVSGGNLNALRDPHKTILLREKKARQSPDGKFVKAYAFCDMTAELISSPGDDFSALEQQRGFLVHPAKN